MSSQGNIAEKIARTSRSIVTNKHSRNTFFLILTIVIVLGLNSFLPLIEGGAHYTEHAVDCTYAEYLIMVEEDDRYALSYTSEIDIAEYKHAYLNAHPELPVEERFSIQVPSTFKVSVYTQFFFQSASWYVTTLTHIVSTILIFYSVFNYILARYKSTYKRYVDLQQEMDTLVNEHIDPPTFEPWMINDFNKPRKIRQHEVNIHTKLEQLEAKTPYTVRSEFKIYNKELENYEVNMKKYNAVEESIIDNTDMCPANITPKRMPVKPVPSRKLKRYINKRNKLLSLLDPFYIENYVVDGRVPNFVYIQPTFVLCGINIVGSTYDSYSLIQSDKQLLGKQAVSRVASITMTTVMFALLTTLTVMSSFDKPWYWVIINIISKVLPLLMQVINAYDYRDNFMETQLIPNLQHRRAISFMYLSSLKNK